MKTFDPSVRNLEQLIVRELGANKLKILREDLFNYLGEHNFIIILDSYDECINFDSLKAEIYSLPGQNPLIITSRDISEINMLKDLNPLMLKLGELSNSEQKKIIINYFKNNDKVKLFISELENQEIGGTERNPLILKLLLLYYSSHEKLTNNLYNLYNFVLDYLLSVESSLPEGIGSVHTYYEIRRNFLRDFSFYLQVNETTSIDLTSFEQFLNSWLIRKTLTEKAGLNIAIKNNLILSTFLVVKGENISFFHRSFQDFFASEIDNPTKVGRKVFKHWFRQQYHHTSLKFYFARTQDVRFLLSFRPKTRRLSFFVRPPFTIWIENYAACLGTLESELVEEKKAVTHLIKTLFLSYSNEYKSSIFLLFHISWIAPVLLRALGYLNFKGATALFFELVRQKSKLDEYALQAIGYFKFEVSDCGALLDLAVRINSHPMYYENLTKQIKAHSSEIGDLILERYATTSDESEKSRLLFILSEHFTYHDRYGVTPSRRVFEFILKAEIDTGRFANDLRRLIHDDDDPDVHKEYNDLFYHIMYEVFQNNGPKLKKKNALNALILVGRRDVRFEKIIIAGIYDKEDDVVLESIIWLPYVFKDKSLEAKYFDRLYSIYEKFPDSRGKILNSINRIQHDINDIEKTFINKSIHGRTYREVATALYLIKKFNLFETLPLLNDFLGNDKYLFKLRCKVMETMIFLNPQLFVDGFNSETIRSFNQKLSEERDVSTIKSIIEDTLQYIGDENTIETLKEIHDKLKEDIPTRYLGEEHRKQSLHFEYLDHKTSDDDKIIRPYQINVFIDRIKEKIQHVRNFGNHHK